MHAFRPQLLSQSEIRAMLAEISPVESRQARKHSLTSLKSQILLDKALARHSTFDRSGAQQSCGWEASNGQQSVHLGT